MDVLCGVKPVLEQIRRDPSRIRRLLVSKDEGGAVARLLEAARQAGVAIVFEDRRALARRAGGIPHQGVVAEVSPFDYKELEDLLGKRPGCLLGVDQVTDPRNLGAMIRSAEAAGIGGVIIPRDRAAGVTEVAAKAAAGATSFVPVARVTNLSRALERAKGAGYWVVGLDAGAKQPLFEFSFPDQCVIVVGSEGKGLRPLIRSGCDHLVSIPMVGQVSSLNVSVAAAVAFFERLRQRHRIDSSSRR